jgi:hypothetical protein
LCRRVQRAQMLRMVSSRKCRRRKVVDYQVELAEASKVALLNALWKRGAGIRSTASIRARTTSARTQQIADTRPRRRGSNARQLEGTHTIS